MISNVIEKIITTGTCGSIEDLTNQCMVVFVILPLILFEYDSKWCVFSPQIDACRVSILTLSVKLG